MVDLIYDPRLTYEENCERDLSEFKGIKCNINANPILKVSAGPVISPKHVGVFAQLGYDIITYKTVGSRKREPHPFPNIFVKSQGKWMNPKDFDWRHIDEIESITNYFGLPSKTPEEWKKDISLAKFYTNNCDFVVSVVGETLEEFIQMVELVTKIADPITELDLSCPNHGRLFYKDINFISDLCKKLTGYHQPFIGKVGRFENKEQVKAFVENSDFYAIEAINTIPTDFDGVQKGVCGPEIIEVGLQNVRWLSEIREELGLDFKLIGTGGVKDRESALRYVAAGADIIGVATMAMFDPELALKVKEKFT